jgi:hypothetical protein
MGVTLILMALLITLTNATTHICFLSTTISIFTFMSYKSVVSKVLICKLFITIVLVSMKHINSSPGILDHSQHQTFCNGSVCLFLRQKEWKDF